jgi:hypothetical protein
VHEGSPDGADTETERGCGDEPAWADPFAAHVGWDLEDDVGDVEDGKNGIVVVACEVKILFETGELCVTWNLSSVHA